MSGVSKEQISQAKSIDLLTYLQSNEPHSIKKISPNEYCIIEHDSLKISNSKWHWFSRGFGGKTALDFLIKVRGIGFVEAVNLLDDGGIAVNSSFQPVTKENSANTPKDVIKPDIILPKASINNNRVVAYLRSRGIDSEVINKCIADGILYEDKKFHNCVFVGKYKADDPRFACVRSTQNHVRLDVKNSDKRYSFSILASNINAKYMLVAEAPIDILSLATIHETKGNYKGDSHYLSLGGGSTLALVQFLKDHPLVENIVVCYDNDNAGIKCMERIKETLKTEYSGKDIKILIREPPPVGKDFNDFLMELQKAQKAVPSKIRHRADIFM